MSQTFYSVVRVFVKDNESGAKEKAPLLINLFKKTTSKLAIEKYYKEEGVYEISFFVEQKNTTPDLALKEVGELLGKGWNYSFMEDPEDYTSFATWSSSENNSFIIDKVIFANLETFYE